jgi:hypothetical protein
VQKDRKGREERSRTHRIPSRQTCCIDLTEHKRVAKKNPGASISKNIGCATSSGRGRGTLILTLNDDRVGDDSEGLSVEDKLLVETRGSTGVEPSI